MEQQQKIKLIAAMLLSFTNANLSAQQTTDAAGGNASGSGGSASYSIGQPVYTTHIGTNGSVAQGVQQPYEISIVTEIKEAKDISLSFLVYPNPTTDFLKLKTENYTSENLRYHLYQLDGKILETKKIESLDVSISMEHLASGIYFLKITELDKDIKTFKIIKN
jgi:hypothetical protein